MNKIYHCLLFSIVLCVLTYNIKAQAIYTIAGDSIRGYSGDNGQSSLAELNTPTGVFVDSSGNVYIADAGNHRVRKVTVSGIITTIAGTGTKGFSGDGSAATSAKLNSPWAVYVDHKGNVYIADAGNHCVRMINTSGTISTIAGTGGTYGYSGDGGKATLALLVSPQSIVVDDSSNIYIADNGNSCIRKVNTAGVISTIAGNGVLWGYSGDGGAAKSATLSNPTGIALDTKGNLYIADWGNNRIRMVTKATGIITTIAGDTLGGYSGDNAAATSAQLFWPRSVAVDAGGKIYIADQENNVVRAIDTAGIITTVVGNGTSGYSGDRGPALAAELQYIAGLAVDAAGHLYIADEGNNVIREVGGTTGVTSVASNKANIQLYPVPNNGMFTLKGYYHTGDETAKIQIINIAGEAVYTDEVQIQNGSMYKTVNVNAANGIYLLHVTTAKDSNTLRFVICN